MAEQDFTQDIKQIYAERFAALASKDLNRVLELYHDEAKFMVPGSETAIGREEIRKILQRDFIDAGIVNMTVDINEVIVLGDTGVERGIFKCLKEHGECCFIGKYVTVWKKQDGKWKTYIDIHNQN